MTETVAPEQPLDDDALERARRRSTRLLIAGSALGSVGHIAFATVVAIATRELLDSAALAGATTTAIILGAAAGTSLLSRLMESRGRRAGLTAGLGVSVLGGLLTVASVLGGWFPLMLLGTLLFGLGNSSMQLARYTSADMADPRRRAWAIGLVVWAATVGAIVGPNIVPLAASAAEGIGLTELVGPLLFGTVVMALAGLLWFATLRPDPYALAHESSRILPDAAPSAPMSHILRRPAVSLAVVAMVVGQVVMVAIMTMTPLHMRDHGHDLVAVGFVISAHTAGMFALSPITGRISQRAGPIPTIGLGLGVLASSAVLTVVAPPDGGWLLLVALFLLGYGWNLGFVAGSVLLMGGVEHVERTRTEGFTDTLVWGSAAIASLASGLVLAAAGFAALGLVSLVLVAVAAYAIVRLRPAVKPPVVVSPESAAS